MKSSPRSGFTLIELLVVIAIIAILASLTVGGVTRALRATKRNVAASEATSVAMAVTLFHKDYGWLPLPASAQGGTGDGVMAVNREVIKTLMATDDTRDVNPKGTVYLDVDTAGEDGQLLDPWDAEYQMMLDLNYDGKIDYAGNTFTTKAVVISLGRDGILSDDDVGSVLLE